MLAGYLITNTVVINEGSSFRGSVLVLGGRIAEIFRGRVPSGLEMPDGIRTIDAGGRLLLPGVIDDQVHFREPGLTEKGDIYTESRAAVAGGITSYMDMPNTIPRATSLEVLEEKYRIASGRSLANFSFFLGAANDNIGEIRKADPATICGLKVFMGASTGNMLVDDQNTLGEIFRDSPLLIAIHSEDEQTIRNNLELYHRQYGDNIPVEAHPLIRSEEACFRSSERAVKLAQKYGSKLHILHLSTARELQLLSKERPLKDKKITGEVCVHHLWFDDRDYADRGSFIKWNPAIKTSSDRLGLFAGVLDDTIDIIATDHAPHLQEEKGNPYLSCPSGAPMVQHSLPAMLTFYHLGRISLEKIVEKMCHNPAILYGIEQRGFIRQGYFADLVLVDPDDPWTVTKENILYKCGWSPMESVTFRSRITHTWVNGHLVFEEGRFHEEIKGQRLFFNQR